MTIEATTVHVYNRINLFVVPSENISYLLLIASIYWTNDVQLYTVHYSRWN